MIVGGKYEDSPMSQARDVMSLKSRGARRKRLAALFDALWHAAAAASLVGTGAVMLTGWPWGLWVGLAGVTGMMLALAGWAWQAADR
jgi:hypothetical protein